MALRANALTTVATAKSQLDILVGDTSQDAFLERLINSASQQIEKYCNRPFVVASFTDYLDGNRCNELMLTKTPVTTITSVHLDSSRAFGSETLLVATDYGVVNGNILRKHSGSWGNGSQIVKVIYSAGFTTIPADVEDACILLVEHRYRLKNDRRLGRTSSGKVNENISYITEWPQEALSLLEPYRVLNYIDGNMAVIV